ncbi:hypothetical protein LCGC14_1453630 [marine sediment metagenome]|uniref:Uncharacterized protein n=1 Tax=marine sediment metagenome TaxID=412755 RepID=A0A0F9K3D7_9ZZZZ
MDKERDYVAEATAQGWKEDFEGPNKTDAQTFVEKGEKIAALAITQRDATKVENAQLSGRIAKLETANKEFGEYKDAQLARSEARNKDLLNELSLRRSQAVTDNDGETFYKLDREIEQVKEGMNAPPPQQGNGGEQPNPLYDAWLINNDWYNNDPTLKAIADGIEGQIASEGYRVLLITRKLLNGSRKCLLAHSGIKRDRVQLALSRVVN